MMTPELMRRLLYDTSRDMDIEDEEVNELLQDALKAAGFFKATEHGRRLLQILSALQSNWRQSLEFRQREAKKIRNYLNGEEEYKPYMGPMA